MDNNKFFKQNLSSIISGKSSSANTANLSNMSNTSSVATADSGSNDVSDELSFTKSSKSYAKTKSIKSNNDTKSVSVSELNSNKSSSITASTANRPLTLEAYIGQENIKKQLKVAIEATKKDNHQLDHILIHGAPGLGKTTLSNIIATELNVKIQQINAPSIEKQGDMAAILSSVEYGSILFIDEIHRLSSNIEEMLYPALEDHKLNVIIGQGLSARTMQIDLPPFTVIGATTKIGNISAPLRDRFSINFKLEPYSEAELSAIIVQTCKQKNYEIDENSIKDIAKRGRGVPRITLNLLKRIADFAIVYNNSYISSEVVKNALEHLQIDEYGLTFADRSYMNALVNLFDNKPVGVSTISASIQEDIHTIENVIEPFLLYLGFIQKTPRGRVATTKGLSFFV